MPGTLPLLFKCPRSGVCSWKLFKDRHLKSKSRSFFKRHVYSSWLTFEYVQSDYARCRRSSVERRTRLTINHDRGKKLEEYRAWRIQDLVNPRGERVDASLLDKLLWPTIFGLTRNYRQIKVSRDVDVVVFFAVGKTLWKSAYTLSLRRISFEEYTVSRHESSSAISFSSCVLHFSSEVGIGH